MRLELGVLNIFHHFLSLFAGCAVPLTLKAEIMEVLAAFAQSPDIAYTLWNSIEVAQILATTATVSTNIKGMFNPLIDKLQRQESHCCVIIF